MAAGRTAPSAAAVESRSPPGPPPPSCRRTISPVSMQRASRPVSGRDEPSSQSRGSRDHRTTSSPAARAARNRAREVTPSGGRYIATGLCNESSRKRRAPIRRRSDCRRGSPARISCTSPCNPISWPAAAASRRVPTHLLENSVRTKNVAWTPWRESTFKRAGVAVGSGPSSKVSTTADEDRGKRQRSAAVPGNRLRARATRCRGVTTPSCIHLGSRSPDDAPNQVRRVDAPRASGLDEGHEGTS